MARAELDFCYLTTTGRTSGLARTIETWFGLEAGPGGGYAPDLPRLAQYFVALESDARGFIRKPDELQQAGAAFERRHAIAEKAAARLDRSG